MSNVFDMLTGGVIGEVTEDGKTYATAPTPPDGDSSTKVATTAFVKTATPSGNVAVWSRDFAVSYSYPYEYIYAPQGGTWFCFGNITTGNSTYGDKGRTWDSTGKIASGGSVIVSYETGVKTSSSWIASNNGLAIKIA